MVETFLYDKEISVTLYKPPKSTWPGFKSSIVQGYQGGVLSGKKLLYNSNVGDIADVSPLDMQLPQTASIEFYEGSTAKVFAGYKKDRSGKDVVTYRKIKFSGNVHKVNTIEQMKTGRSSAGNMFMTGDRIYVVEDRTTWTAVLYKGGQELTYGEAEEQYADTLTIATTNSGLKPDMALTISLLPGQNCYNAVLKIRNLNIDAVSIREWTRMEITAGYRTGKKVKFICPIFTSYIESPNPDGITTFEGITVGTAEDSVSTQFIEIRFVQNKMKLSDLIREVAPAISPNIEVDIMVDSKIMNEEITISRQTVYSQNGLAVLNWLQSTISAFVEAISLRLNGEKTSIFMQLVDNRLEVIALNGPNKMVDKVRGVVNLDMVSGATFNGTALTVEAPWNPDLRPGGLFYMPPEFIYGSKLPNVLPTSDYRNESNLYRALTMSLAFGSVEGTNKMTILAVPAQWAGEIRNNKTTEMTGEMFAQTLAANTDIVQDSIEIGKSDVDIGDLNKIDKAVATGKKMYDAYSGEALITAWGSWISVDINTDCLSVVLERYLIKDPTGPRLIEGKGKNKETRYYKTLEDFENESNAMAQSHFSNNGCWANAVWWPLVVVGTYWRRQIDIKAGVSNNWSKTDPKNPDSIDANKALYIPVFSTWTSMEAKLKSVRGIFKYAYQEYGKRYGDLANTWRTMYYYLGGTDDIG